MTQVSADEWVNKNVYVHQREQQSVFKRKEITTHAVEHRGAWGR